MLRKDEKLLGKAAVKGTMVQARLSWVEKNIPGGASVLLPKLDEKTAKVVSHGILATDWVTLESLITLDRAIASQAGGLQDKIWRELGKHSAQLNLGGVYKKFVPDEPHRFFEQMAFLHSRFQNFGRSSYERIDTTKGRIRIEDYEEYSPVYCTSGEGYYAESLLLMKVPGPVFVRETTCQCREEEACVYDLSW